MKKDTERQLSIRFPLTLFQLIAKEAAEQRRSFNAQVIWMLQDYLQLRAKEK